MTLIDGHLRTEELEDDYEVDVAILDVDRQGARELLASFDPLAMLATPEIDPLKELYESLAPIDDVFEALLGGYIDDASTIETAGQTGIEKGKVPGMRTLPVDAIFTIKGEGGAMCCLACYSGLKYGTQSGDTESSTHLCPRVNPRALHKLEFIDNDFRVYDHQHHVNFVSQHFPKYATVRDLMTKKQSQEAGIEHFSAEAVFDFAAEMKEHCENVILIPKYDAGMLDKIPDEYVLGYSIPTSHGFTPLPLEAFRGRRVHLLGGSWDMQLAAMEQLGDDVVSFDNNHALLVAKYGQFCLPDGGMKTLPDIGFDKVANPLYISLAISFGNIVSKVREIYKGESNE